MPSLETRVALVENTQESLLSDMSDVKGDVRIIRDTINKSKGTLIALFFFANAAGSVINSVVSKFLHLIN